MGELGWSVCIFVASDEHNSQYGCSRSFVDQCGSVGTSFNQYGTQINMTTGRGKLGSSSVWLLCGDQVGSNIQYYLHAEASTL
jgi:hypothetical protein